MNQVGIDISNAVFDATMQHGSHVVRKQFLNTKTGHRQFIRWALYQASSARVCLEATGIYHLQLALALDRRADIELMVVNPCAARRFAQAHMVRAKTDARKYLAVYLGLRNYRNNLLSLGFSEEDFERGGSDRLVDALVAWGDETKIHKHLDAHWNSGADHVCIQLLRADGGFGYDQKALEAFAPGG